MFRLCGMLTCCLWPLSHGRFKGAAILDMHMEGGQYVIFYVLYMLYIVFLCNVFYVLEGGYLVLPIGS